LPTGANTWCDGTIASTLSPRQVHVGPHARDRRADAGVREHDAARHAGRARREDDRRDVGGVHGWARRLRTLRVACAATRRCGVANEDVERDERHLCLARGVCRRARAEYLWRGDEERAFRRAQNGGGIARAAAGIERHHDAAAGENAEVCDRPRGATGDHKPIRSPVRTPDLPSASPTARARSIVSP
jgi:hypothetical protein